MTNLYQNFNLTITPGSILGVVGYSGSGKSTLFNLITKLDEPSSGKIAYDNLPLSLMSFHDIQQLVSYVTQ